MLNCKFLKKNLIYEFVKINSKIYMHVSIWNWRIIFFDCFSITIFLTHLLCRTILFLKCFQMVDFFFFIVLNIGWDFLVTLLFFSDFFPHLWLFHSDRGVIIRFNIALIDANRIFVEIDLRNRATQLTAPLLSYACFEIFQFPFWRNEIWILYIDARIKKKII